MTLSEGLVGDPVLLIGKRLSSGRLDIRQLPADRSTYTDLVNLCVAPAQFFDAAKKSVYAPHGALEEDECFALDASGLFQTKRRRRTGRREADGVEPEAEVASLVQAALSPGSAERLTFDDLGGFRPTFTMIAFPDSEPSSAFVRKQSPITMLRPGFRYFLYGDVVRSTAQPDLALGPHDALVVSGETLLVRDEKAFLNLFTDTGIALQAIPQSIDSIERGLQGIRELSPEASFALARLAVRRVGIAKRLRELPGRLAVTAAVLSDSAQLRTILESHEIEPDSLLAGPSFHFADDAAVEIFLDLVEGRYFKDDFTGEQRRADRWRPR